MGTERNGLFVTEDDKAEKDSAQKSGESAGSVQSAETATLPAPLRARIGRTAKWLAVVF
jgi:hypothetical protein